MAKQDFEILGGLKIGSTLAFDSNAQIQIANVGLETVAGTGSIADLVDVDINTGTIQNGQILKWDATSSKFTAGTDSDTFLTGLTNANNTALGVDAYSTRGGADNVAIGHSALKVSTGSGNTAIGDDAGVSLVSGDNNVIIGRINGSTIEGKDGQVLIANGAGTLIMSADSAQAVSMVGDADVSGVLTFGSTTETTDKISEGSTNLYYTRARWDSALGTVSTADLAEGSNLYYTTARFDSDFGDNTTDDLTQGSNNLYYSDSSFNLSLASKTTADLAEGSNLYYTRARWDSDLGDKTTDDVAEGSSNFYYSETLFNTSLGTKTTSDLAEGTNLYYTRARWDSDLGDKSTDDIAEGSSLYYTQARFDSAFNAKSTDDLSQGSSNLYYSDSSFNLSLASKTTDDVAEGSNLYYTTARFDSDFGDQSTADLAEDPNATVNSGTMYYTDARARAAARADLQAGTGVTYDSINGIISIGQEVHDSADVQFGSINIDDVVVMDTEATAANASAVVISSIAAADFRSMRVTIQASHDGDHHTSEMLVLHDGTNALTTEFGAIKTSGSALATFAAAVNGGNVEITATPVGGIDPEYKIVRHSTKV